jgi:two-component system response regulator NreC
MREKVPILIIGEEGLLRDGLCALLETDDCTVIGALSAVAQQSLQQDPAVIILDGAAERDWNPLVAAIRSRWSAARVIVLTSHPHSESPEYSRLAAADAYVPKSARGLQLIEVVNALVKRSHHVSGAPAPPESLDFGRGSPLRSRVQTGLSDREREVMRQIARGFRTREIALHLSLSRKTIEKHRSNLMRKLGLRSATAVTAYAIAHGYLDP